jgi:hypothetical protein
MKNIILKIWTVLSIIIMGIFLAFLGFLAYIFIYLTVFDSCGEVVLKRNFSGDDFGELYVYKCDRGIAGNWRTKASDAAMYEIYEGRSWGQIKSPVGTEFFNGGEGNVNFYSEKNSRYCVPYEYNPSRNELNYVSSQKDDCNGNKIGFFKKVLEIIGVIPDIFMMFYYVMPYNVLIFLFWWF